MMKTLLFIATLCDWLKSLAPSKIKTNPTCTHAFSRAWCLQHVFASSSDWFIGLFASSVIGQSDDYFGFEFTTLIIRIIGSLTSPLDQDRSIYTARLNYSQEINALCKS